jgi:hypothetical protein
MGKFYNVRQYRYTTTKLIMVICHKLNLACSIITEDENSNLNMLWFDIQFFLKMTWKEGGLYCRQLSTAWSDQMKVMILKDQVGLLRDLVVLKRQVPRKRGNNGNGSPQTPSTSQWGNNGNGSPQTPRARAKCLTRKRLVFCGRNLDLGLCCFF